MNHQRASGILLHPTSLPGPFAIGNIGPEAFRFIDQLEEMRQVLWQVLPLYPTGYGDSPYAALSAFAGNPLLISPELLREKGLLNASDIPRAYVLHDSVDFKLAKKITGRLLKKAYRNFRDANVRSSNKAFNEFCHRNSFWLDDFGLYMAIKEHHGLKPWSKWPKALMMREESALEGAQENFSDEIRYHSFLQFLFYEQWLALRKYANEKGIRIIGDNPIYEAYDSADVWAHPDLFLLDKERKPTLVAGVPPDCFSKTGQLWGNPLYDWAYHKKTHYHWWKQNLQASFDLTDYVRIDHFIGFVRYYAIPYGHKTAERGRWNENGPGLPFFKEMKRHFGTLPLLAEDLGATTPKVMEVKSRMGFPGMKILQEAFDGNPGHHFLPHNYTPDHLVYTGTHDTNTTRAVLEKMSLKNRRFLSAYLQVDTKSSSRELVWHLIALALSSVAEMSIVPMQDLLGLGEKARMNLPGTVGGNWVWRYRPQQLNTRTVKRMRELTELYGRSVKKIT
jgi:4-alpha-glucanotransferase